METNLYLYGGSGHCKVIVDILESAGRRVKAIVDDNPRSRELFGIPVIGAGQFENGNSMILSVGNNRTRKKISGMVRANFETAVHARAYVSPRSFIGEGSVVMAGAMVNPDSHIGRHCIINTGAIVEHDARIGDFAHISPGAALAGNVTVGEGSHIGINAAVIQGVKIGKWATIGAGAVVIRDVPDFAVAVGNPAKIIKYIDHEQH